MFPSFFCKPEEELWRREQEQLKWQEESTLFRAVLVFLEDFFYMFAAINAFIPVLWTNLRY